MGRRGRRRRRTAGAAARSPDILHADTALAAVTEQLEGMKVHAATALAAVTEQLEGMKVAGERRVEVLTRRQEWREELTAQQAVVSFGHPHASCSTRPPHSCRSQAHQHPCLTRQGQDVWPLPQPCLRRPPGILCLLQA